MDDDGERLISNAADDKKIPKLSGLGNQWKSSVKEPSALELTAVRATSPLLSATSLHSGEGSISPSQVFFSGSVIPQNTDSLSGSFRRLRLDVSEDNGQRVAHRISGDMFMGLIFLIQLLVAIFINFIGLIRFGVYNQASVSDFYPSDPLYRETVLPYFLSTSTTTTSASTTTASPTPTASLAPKLPIIPSDPTNNIILSVVILSIMISTASIVLVSFFPKLASKACFGFIIMFHFCAGLYTWCFGEPRSGIFLVLLGLLYLSFIHASQYRIALSETMLHVASVIYTQKYGITLFSTSVALLSLFVGYTLFCFFGFLGYMMLELDFGDANNVNYSPGIDRTSLFLMLSYFWTIQFLWNAFGVLEGNIIANFMLRRPFKFWFRIISKIGALSIMTAIYIFSQVVHISTLLISSISSRVIYNVLDVGLEYVETGVGYWGSYIFTHLAIYGSTFLVAVKDVHHLFAKKGIVALVNDMLENFVILSLCYSLGLLAAIIGNGLTRYLYPPYYQFIRPNQSIAEQSYTIESYIFLLTLFSFLLGFWIMYLFLLPIRSGYTVAFLLFVQNRRELQHSCPEVFRAMQQVFPKNTGFWSIDGWGDGEADGEFKERKDR